MRQTVFRADGDNGVHQEPEQFVAPVFLSHMLTSLIPHCVRSMAETSDNRHLGALLRGRAVLPDLSGMVDDFFLL